MSTIAGIFNVQTHAEQAVANLLDAGFEKENISLIVSDKARDAIFSPLTDSDGERTTRGSAAGALWGGALGALVAALSAVGTIVIPGAGLLAAGPIVAVLAGAGTGAMAGGLSGALISAGVSATEASRYEKEIKTGKAVLLVEVTNKNATAARRILSMMDATVKAA